MEAAAAMKAAASAVETTSAAATVEATATATAMTTTTTLGESRCRGEQEGTAGSGEYQANLLHHHKAPVKSGTHAFIFVNAQTGF
jgi:hypothetical protein